MRITVAAASLFLVLACSRETPDVSRNSPSQSTTMTAAPAETSSMNPMTPTETASGDSAKPIPAAQAEQSVGLEEYRIRMEPQLAAGKQVFSVANAGKEDHAFEIEGNGVHTKTQVLKRGDSAKLEVDLPPGTYTVYCPVNGHRGKGMQTTITVQ